MAQRPSQRATPAGTQRDLAPTPRTTSWTFLTNHAHVLIYLVGQPDATLREVALAVGITERAVQRVVAELERDGVLERLRQGRRNSYRVHLEQALRHPVESHRSVRDLLEFVHDPARVRAATRAPAPAPRAAPASPSKASLGRRRTRSRVGAS
jgi:predicted transcriptional regulator